MTQNIRIWRTYTTLLPISNIGPGLYDRALRLARTEVKSKCSEIGQGRHIWLGLGWPGLDPEWRRDGDILQLLRVLTGPRVHSAFFKMSAGVFTVV